MIKWLFFMGFMVNFVYVYLMYSNNLTTKHCISHFGISLNYPFNAQLQAKCCQNDFSIYQAIRNLNEFIRVVEI